MSLTFGFYNSKDHDRMYDARDFSRIFDGIIRDGIYATIGDCFLVREQSENIVTVGTGRAWFNGTWTLNDALYPVIMPLSDVARPRTDAIVLEIDTRDSHRVNSVRVLTGTPASLPAPPNLTPQDEGVYWYPLCFIHRDPGVDSIRQKDIENRIGFDATPFVTGILQILDLDELLIQWRDKLDYFVETETADFTKWRTDTQNTFEEWRISNQNAFEAWRTSNQNAFDLWRTENQEAFNRWKTETQNDLELWIELLKERATAFQNESEINYEAWLDALQKTFNNWFAGLKVTLDGDVATNLIMQIRERDFEHIITVGFADGIKTFSEDGTVIESVASDGRTLTKTFSDGFSRLITVLKSPEGSILATQMKEFDPDGKVITSSVTYI